MLLKGIEDFSLIRVPVSFILVFSSLRKMEKTHSATTLVGSGDECWMLL